MLTELFSHHNLLQPEEKWLDVHERQAYVSVGVTQTALDFGLARQQPGYRSPVPTQL